MILKNLISLLVLTQLTQLALVDSLGTATPTGSKGPFGPWADNGSASYSVMLDSWVCSDCARACTTPPYNYPYYCANPPLNCCECSTVPTCSLCTNIC